MRAPARIAVVFFVAGATLACGYLRAGKWEDDPKNWKRAFGSIKPPDVVVVHSLYWRAPHFTFEAGYLFEIEPNETLKRQLFTKNRLEPLAADQMRSFGEPPDWFAPRPIEAYEVWGYADEPRGNFRVLIDKDTGTMFLSDFQI